MTHTSKIPNNIGFSFGGGYIDRKPKKLKSVIYQGYKYFVDHKAGHLLNATFTDIIPFDSIDPDDLINILTLVR